MLEKYGETYESEHYIFHFKKVFNIYINIDKIYFYLYNYFATENIKNQEV